MIPTLMFCALGCSEMSAWKLDKSSELGAWPEGPATVPDDPGDLDSGTVTPFSQLNPDKEVWVASYCSDTAAGTLFEPKRTIGEALLVATPGTAIMVKAGVYKENLTVDAGGVSGKPIWLRSADGKGAAEMAALLSGAEALKLAGVNAVIVEGFKINGGVAIQTSTNAVFQNNIITNGLADGINADSTVNLFLIANDISASPRGQGIQLMACRNVLIADSYIHDLRTSGTKNDGINLKGDTRDVMIQNNIVDRIDGTALVLEGINVAARANALTGTRRAVNFSGCESCSLERNNLHLSTGVMSDVGLTLGDSPQYPTANIKLTSNCVYRTDWLYVESGTGAGLINQSNSQQACQ
jgi:hypothetical protein